MATVIYPSGVVVNIGRPTFEEVKRLLDGGYVQVVTTADGGLMAIDEDGKLKRLPVNPKATTYFLGQHTVAMCLMTGRMLPDTVAGVAILFDSNSEADLVLGGPESEADYENENDWENMVRTSKAGPRA